MAAKPCFLIWFQIAVTSIVSLKVSASQNVMHSTPMNIHIQTLAKDESETYVDDLSEHLSSTEPVQSDIKLAPNPSPICQKYSTLCSNTDTNEPTLHILISSANLSSTGICCTRHHYPSLAVITINIDNPTDTTERYLYAALFDILTDNSSNQKQKISGDPTTSELPHRLWSLLNESSLYTVIPQSAIHSISQRSLLSSTKSTPITLSYSQKVNFLQSVNTARSSAAKGQGVIFGGSNPSRYQISTAMESMIWDNALSLTASAYSNQCQYSYSDTNHRTESYFNTYSNDRIPIINPLDSKSIGETIYKHPIHIDVNDISDDYNIDTILGLAITSWIEGCSQWLYFSMKCRNGHDIECMNCLQFLAERTRYIGCGLSLCSNANANGNQRKNSNFILVICNYYYGTTTFNLKQNGAFIPYFDGTANGICSGCTTTDRVSCDLSIGLCTGCPSLNFDVCSYSNLSDLTNSGNIECSDYLIVDDAECDIDGIHSMNPTIDYSDHLLRSNPSGDSINSLSPTPTPFVTLDILFVLESMNAKRSDVANGKVLHFGSTPIYAKNMESLMWDEALSIVAAISIENICQNDEILSDMRVSKLYKEYEDESAVELSDRLENIKVGTTRYIIKEDQVSSHFGDLNHNSKGIVLQALDSWIAECEYFMYGASCDGYSDDASKCANCLQLIWSKTRYTGCAVDRCSNEETNIIFLCHYYWSADLENDGDVALWTQPFDFGISDNDICASCSDTERNKCDPDTHLCIGCAHNNYYRCTAGPAFNGQIFGNEGCALSLSSLSCYDGIATTMTPSASPTASLTLSSSGWLTTQSPTSWSKEQILTVLNTANAIRSDVANGMYTNGINTNGVEQWIWNRALSQTAYCVASRCDDIETDPQELAMRFVAANDGLSESEKLVLPEDLEKIHLGETRFFCDDDQYSIDEINAIFSKALDEWIGDCRYYNAMENRCHGGDQSDCSECIQMLWADTRFFGCGYAQCWSGEHGVIEVVCHYYHGAGEVGVDMPLSFGTVCSGCESRTDRNECEGSENLCHGCPAHDAECEENGITAEFYEQICPELHFSSEPTQKPTSVPTMNPSGIPSNSPSQIPSVGPTFEPTYVPSTSPTDTTTKLPTPLVTWTPSITPSYEPTARPTDAPTEGPTSSPTKAPIARPTESPSISPTLIPTRLPSEEPTVLPSFTPSIDPSAIPSTAVITSPTTHPTYLSLSNPTTSPSDTISPSAHPSPQPTVSPSKSPTTVLIIAPSTEDSTDETPPPTSVPVTRCYSVFLSVAFVTSSTPAVIWIVLYGETGHHTNPWQWTIQKQRSQSFINSSFCDIDIGSIVLSKMVTFSSNALTLRTFGVEDKMIRSYRNVDFRYSEASGTGCSVLIGDFEYHTFSQIEEMPCDTVPHTVLVSRSPTVQPTSFPSASPSQSPTNLPTGVPIDNSLESPTNNPSESPSDTLTTSPTPYPSEPESLSPTKHPTFTRSVPTPRPTQPDLADHDWWRPIRSGNAAEFDVSSSSSKSDSVSWSSSSSSSFSSSSSSSSSSSLSSSSSSSSSSDSLDIRDHLRYAYRYGQAYVDEQEH